MSETRRPKVEVDPVLTGEVDSGPVRARRSKRPPSRLPDDEPRSKRPRFGLPLWVWVLVLLAGLATAILLLDLRNRDRYLIICDEGTMALHQGRRFPWPLGHRAAGGPNLDPVSLSKGVRCHEREFASQQEAERAFLERLLVQVRAVLDRPGEAVGEDVRKQVHQATGLSRIHTAYHKDARQLSAEVSYREARQSLARVEDELRGALARFREVKSLGGLGHADVERWIRHLESLMQAVAPSPGQAKKTPSINNLLESLKFPLPVAPDAGLVVGEKPNPDASPPAKPDAGPPPTPGILM